MSLSTNSVLSKINVLIHFIGSIQFCAGVYYHWKVSIPVDVNPLDSAYGDKFKYLTFWDACIQAFYFSLCVIIDIFVKSNPNKPPTVVKFKHFLFATIGFPIACFVSIIFWGIYAIDRELVLPRALDPYFPFWLNHLLHTMVMVFALLEMLTATRPYPKRSRGLTTLVIFTVVYVVWVHIIFAKSNQWVYPILKELNFPARMLFFAVMLAFVLFLYFVGESLNKLMNKKVHKPVESSVNCKMSIIIRETAAVDI